MRKSFLPLLLGFSCVMFVVTGCSSSSRSTTSSGGGSGSGGSTPVTSAAPCYTWAPVSGPSVYVVDDTHDWSGILVFPQTANGHSSSSLEVPGTMVSTDGAGNIYALTPTAIVEYSASSPCGTPLRSLPVGPGKQIQTVNDMQASATGEIYVVDGKGIAVFSSTATGDAKPARYIQGINPLSSPALSLPVTLPWMARTTCTCWTSRNP